MKRIVVYFLAFSIVFAAMVGACYLINLFVGLVFHQSWFAGWREYVVIGFAGAMAGTFGPVLFALIEKRFKK
ncbi:MAG: hypothetical protein K2L74_04915 [Muribaculaceae bacterium]|nr:hypothetical protein [Muribaculaceae bacterium]